MKNNKNSLLEWLGVAVAVVLLACTCRVTIIPDEVVQTTVNEAGETVVVEKLSVTDQYAADNWDSKIVPAVKERAVEMAQMIADVEKDLNAAGQAYGNRANETSAWSFCVTMTGKVVGLENAEKSNKIMLLLDLAPYDGTADCKLFYGDKAPSASIKNAIRDGVGFLHLDDFANQVEFADLTTSFNNKVKNDITLQTPAAGLEGKEIQVYGCLSLTAAKAENYVVIPVTLEIVGG